MGYKKKKSRRTHPAPDKASGTTATEQTAAQTTSPAEAQAKAQPPAAPAAGAARQPSAWIQGLDRVVRMTAGEHAPNLRTTLSCHIKDETRTLFLPAEMPTLQARSLRYLSAFGMRNHFQLVEDRRQSKVSPVIEQRNAKPPAVTLGLALLMKQAGLKGPVATLSYPHRLEADNKLIDLPELISMAAQAAPSAKQIVALPNRPLVDVLDNDTQPIAGFGCRMQTAGTRTLLTHFEGDALRCLGYSTGSQYVMHILLAGGPLSAPTLWTHPRTLTRTNIRFRLFHGHNQAHDFGLLYSTFYFNMAAQHPTPWWLSREFAGKTELQGSARSAV